MGEENDDFEITLWDDYKSRKENAHHRGKHTYRAMHSNCKYSNKRINYINNKRYKHFNVYFKQIENTIKLRDKLLDQINIFENEKLPGSLNTTMIMNQYGHHYDHTEYSLNKKKRWLLPELIDSLVDENLKVDTIETRENNRKWSCVKRVKLAEDVQNKTELLINECNCRVEFRYKNGNRYIVKNHKCKQELEKQLPPKELKQAELLFDFNYGYNKRFERLNVPRCDKPNKFQNHYKNYESKQRQKVINHMKDDFNDIPLSIKSQIQKKENPIFKFSKMFYVLRKKMLKKITSDGTYNTDWLYGVKSFKSKNPIKKLILNELEKISSTSIEIRNKTQCEICYEDLSCLLSLEKCQHRACYACWNNYAKTKIDEFQQSNGSPITCLHQNCDTILDLEFLKKISGKHVNRYKESYVEIKLNRSEKYTMCSSKTCDKALIMKPENSSDKTIICDCNNTMCAMCKRESHFPLSCSQYSAFKTTSINADSSLTQGKYCPRCGRYIEKNGGCRHMRCVCGHNFCWICSLPILQHYKCVESDLIRFGQDFFEDNNTDPNIYRYLFELRGLVRVIDSQSDYAKTISSISNCKLYKDFKLYMSGFDENTDLIMKNVMNEIYLTLKQLAYFSLYYSHLNSIYSINKQYERVQVEKLKEAFEYVRKLYRLYLSANSLKHILETFKLISDIKRFMAPYKYKLSNKNIET